MKFLLAIILGLTASIAVAGNVTDLNVGKNGLKLTTTNGMDDVVSSKVHHNFPLVSNTNITVTEILGGYSRNGPYVNFFFRMTGDLAASGNPSFFFEVPFDPKFVLNQDASGSINADDQQASGYCRASTGTGNVIECYIGTNWAPSTSRAAHVTGSYLINN